MVKYEQPSETWDPTAVRTSAAMQFASDIRREKEMASRRRERDMANRIGDREMANRRGETQRRDQVKFNTFVRW